METSPLPMKSCKILAYARRSGPLRREGSLSCHTCCDMGPRFFVSHPKDRPIQSPLTTREGMWRIYSNPDPHGSLFRCLLRHTRGCGGPILARILIHSPLRHTRGCGGTVQTTWKWTFWKKKGITSSLNRSLALPVLLIFQPENIECLASARPRMTLIDTLSFTVRSRMAKDVVVS
jgi:hypothetical protein